MPMEDDWENVEMPLSPSLPQLSLSSTSNTGTITKPSESSSECVKMEIDTSIESEKVKVVQHDVAQGDCKGTEQMAPTAISPFLKDVMSADEKGNYYKQSSPTSLSFSKKTTCYGSLVKIRKFVSDEGDIKGIHDQEILQTPGFVQRILALMKNENADFQYHAIWIATNLFARPTITATDIFVDAGVTPILFDLLKSKFDHVSHQALWTLGNMAGNPGNKYRLMLLEQNVIGKIIKEFSNRLETKSKKFTPELKTLSWVLEVLTTGTPICEAKYFLQAMPFMVKMILLECEGEVLYNCIWFFIHMMTRDNSYPDLIKALIENAEFVKRIVDLLGHKDRKVRKSSLDLVGNLAYANSDINIKVLIDAGVLICLEDLLSSAHVTTRRIVTITLSNFCSGSNQHIQEILDFGFANSMADMLKDEKEDVIVKCHICFFFSNVINEGNHQQFDKLLKLQVPKLIVAFINKCNLILQKGQQQHEEGEEKGEKKKEKETQNSLVAAAETLYFLCRKVKDPSFIKYKLDTLVAPADELESTLVPMLAFSNEELKLHIKATLDLFKKAEDKDDKDDKDVAKKKFCGSCYHSH